MKKISKVLALFLALAFLMSSCVMGGGDDDKKDPQDVTDTPDRVDPDPEPEPPEPDAPDIDINVSDTVPIR